MLFDRYPINRALLRLQIDENGQRPLAWTWRKCWMAMCQSESYIPHKNLMSAIGWLLGLCFGTLFCLFACKILGTEHILGTWTWIHLLFILGMGLICGGFLGSFSLFWVTEFQQLDRQLVFFRENSEVDILSGLHNRRGFMERLDTSLNAFHRGVYQDLSLLFIDIDHFKRCNDTFGHAFGDKVIQTLGEFIERIHRGADYSARWGGEEFVILAHGTTLEQAVRFAERLRTGIEALPIYFEGQATPITISIGVTSIRSDDTQETFLERADGMLYQAKEKGRNQVQWIS